MSLLFTAVLFVFVFLFRVALSIHSSSVSFCLPAFFAETFSVCSNPGSFCFSALFTTISLFLLALCLANLLRSLQFCLILLPLTRSLCRFSSIALHLLTLALCLSLSLSLSGRLALRLKPVVYTLQSLCCCLLT